MLQEFTQEMKDRNLDMMRDVHTSVPGVIVTFDPDKCEAQVQPKAKYRKPDGTVTDYPQINQVPVYFNQSCDQSATIAWPVRPGDYCLVLFSEQALDTWRTGAESVTELRHDLTNAVAIVGLFVKANPLVKEACQDNSLIVEKDGQRLRLKTGESYIRDTFGQSITLTPTAVTVIANNFKVQAREDITMKAGGHVTVTASDISLN